MTCAAQCTHSMLMDNRTQCNKHTPNTRFALPRGSSSVRVAAEGSSCLARKEAVLESAGQGVNAVDGLATSLPEHLYGGTR